MQVCCDKASGSVVLKLFVHEESKVEAGVEEMPRSQETIDDAEKSKSQ